jgi:hypothetical protein
VGFEEVHGLVEPTFFHFEKVGRQCVDLAWQVKFKFSAPILVDGFAIGFIKSFCTFRRIFAQSRDVLGRKLLGFWFPLGSRAVPGIPGQVDLRIVLPRAVYDPH